MINLTPISQILAKIVLHNILPKSGEFSHARGCAPLLIYCLQRGIQVNIPKLILDNMTSDYHMIPNRNLPHGMVLSHIFKHYHVDLLKETPTPPAVSINHTLLKRCIRNTTCSTSSPG